MTRLKTYALHVYFSLVKQQHQLEFEVFSLFRPCRLNNKPWQLCLSPLEACTK